MAGRLDYEERRQERIDRLNGAAEKARADSTRLMQESHDLVDGIPFGQPILMGRGSRTTADINRREKSWNKIGAAVEADKKADYYENRAEAAENNTAISSDDPNSIEKLQAKIDELKKEQTIAKALNAHYRKNKTCKGFVCGDYVMTDERAEKLDKSLENSLYHIPYPPYSLTSINQRIKAAEDRIAKIRQTEQMPDEVIEFNGFTIESSSADNRVSIKFDDRVSPEICSRLKSNGFKWSYTLGRWQRLRTPWAWTITKRLAEEFSKMVGEQ
ncbi:MAG: DUF3560 domain-containing protein [Clostridia bacterium]|nr:DUF3560 domain-containing protein [Clostridia bacterium]